VVENPHDYAFINLNKRAMQGAGGYLAVRITSRDDAQGMIHRTDMLFSETINTAAPPRIMPQLQMCRARV
jgi:hypothetical protein